MFGDNIFENNALSERPLVVCGMYRKIVIYSITQIFEIFWEIETFIKDIMKPVERIKWDLHALCLHNEELL